MPAAAMPPVHEEMHDGAGEQQEVWQKAEHVRLVFPEKEEPSDGEEDEECDGEA